MDEKIRELLERQAAWQRGRASLSWEEKLEMSLTMPEAQEALRKQAGSRPEAPKSQPDTSHDH